MICPLRWRWVKVIHAHVHCCSKSLYNTSTWKSHLRTRTLANKSNSLRGSIEQLQGTTVKVRTAKNHRGMGSHLCFWGASPTGVRGRRWFVALAACSARSDHATIRNLPRAWLTNSVKTVVCHYSFTARSNAMETRETQILAKTRAVNGNKKRENEMAVWLALSRWGFDNFLRLQRTN